MKNNEHNEDSWPFDQPRNSATLTVRQVIDGLEPILSVYHYEDEHCWQFFGACDVNLADTKVVSLESIVDLDSTVLEVADLPVGWQATRSDIGEAWMRFEVPTDIDEPEEIIITPVPSLVSILLNREQAKGSPLTKLEVETIRDQVICVALSSTQRAAMDESRGYLDIVPEQAWEAWQIARLDFDLPNG